MASKQSKLPDSAIMSTSIYVQKGIWKAFQIAAINGDLSLRDALNEALADWVMKMGKKKKAPGK